MTDPTLDVPAFEVGMDHAIHGASHVATWVRGTARLYGIHFEPPPMDSFAATVSRLADAEVTLDPIEQLLLALHRHHVISDAQRFALHATYLRQRT